MGPNVGFGAGGGGFFEKRRLNSRVGVKRAFSPTSTIPGECAPIPPSIGFWYLQKFWRHGWVFASNYGHLTLHALCMSMPQSPKRIRFSIGSTITRSCTCGNSLTQRSPDSGPQPPRSVAICRIATLLTYGEFYIPGTPRPMLLLLLRADA